MKGTGLNSGGATARDTLILPLHKWEPIRRAVLNRVFAAVYTCGVLALLYHHAQTLLHSKTSVSFFMTFSLLVSDLILAFIWATSQSFRMYPIRRKQFPENLKKVVGTSEFPAIDVFICTADPYKEPPISAVNTALSVMAYDYPTEKISVYLSDDGGSSLTLFAFMEAAKFSRHWLPFCRKNNVEDRSPEAYFASNNHHYWSSETEKIKIMYENMKMKVEHILERGKVLDEYINKDEEREAFNKWKDGFTRQDHPTVIQVLLESGEDKDVSGHLMPNLIYLSREKSRTSSHHFKAGALNALLRVSAIMTNSPIILTLDCDMYSNDPGTLLRALCYLLDPAIKSKLGYVQFPQIFSKLNKNDIYACEFKRLFQINPLGQDGLLGPPYVGTGSFFNRRVFFGGPSALIPPEIQELRPDNVVHKPIKAEETMALAHHVGGCSYENQTDWGYKIGFRYGSLVEDYYTGYRLQCEGWRSVFCKPERAAFYGDAPVSLVDVLNQNKRWSIGLLEVLFSRYSPVTYGVQAMGLLMGLGYAWYGLWGVGSIPITTYAFLPQLALLNGVSIFPEVSEPWFLLYVLLFLGAYGQDLLDFVLEGGTVQRWWNNQRMWMVRGVSCFLFGFTEFALKCLGISTHGFNVTTKVLDDEQSKRYDQEIFEFGVSSPLFLPLTMAAIINLFAFFHGFIKLLSGNNNGGQLLQLLLTGFVVLNSQPIYEAMVLRSDKGKLTAKTTVLATLFASALYLGSSLILK